MLIRDPIHGDIDLSVAEAAVLDSAEVQRLRTIKQLGTAYLVYPGCMHTRFEHSLGTMAVVKRILAGLEKSGTKISPEDQELVAIGALLHDITHIPFGHTFEDERKIFPRHDKGPRLQYYLRPESELGGTLARLGIAAEIAALLQAQTNDWRVEIISSALDADLLDYLKRDAYMAGLAQTYDQRIFQHFLIVDNQLLLNMVKHNMDRPDVKSEITHLLRLRYYLTERVYFHH
ncbi:MAG TPA: HD domain-containing protein, partial [Desulfobacteria bacterium]|nr:HD domain-containing protein [Desulfobacteria bacterium]